MTQEDYEPKLSWVLLNDDNNTIMLNGDEKYSGRLPMDTFNSRKNKSFNEPTSIVESVIYNTCAQHGIDSYSSENVTNCAREVVELFYGRQQSKQNNKKRLGSTQWGNFSSNTTASSPTTNTMPTVVQLGPEEQKEVSWDDIANVLSISIKKDEASKLITFCALLLAQTNEDQLNLGFQAESSSGKSYVPIELSNYFPENEVMKFAAASPTAFYHRGGTWDEQRKAIICDLQHKI